MRSNQITNQLMSVPTTSNFQAKPKMQLQAMLQGNIFRLPAPAPRGRDLICVRERVRAATLYTVVVRVVCLSCESMLSDFCLRSLIESLSHVALFRINAVAPAAAATSARRESVGGGRFQMQTVHTLTQSRRSGRRLPADSADRSPSPRYPRLCPGRTPLGARAHRAHSGLPRALIAAATPRSPRALPGRAKGIGTPRRGTHGCGRRVRLTCHAACR